MNPTNHRTAASAFICLWFAVSGFQLFHEWNHHHSCQHHSQVSHEHKAEQACHDGANQLAERNLVGGTFHRVHECLICDWDWAPTEHIGSDGVVLEAPNWAELIKVGHVFAGYARSPFDNTQSRRGPPGQG